MKKIITICLLSQLFFSMAQAQAPEIATSTAEADQQLSVNLLYPPSVVTNNSTIYARTNKVADSVKFYVYGPENTIYPGQLSGNSASYFFNYFFNWDVSLLSDGDYRLQAEAELQNKKATSTLIDIKIFKTANASNNIATATPPLVETASSTEQSADIASSTLDTLAQGGVGVQIISPETDMKATSTVKIITKTFGGVKKVELVRLSGQDNVLISSDEPKSINFDWEYVWDLKDMSSGAQTLQSIAYDSKDNKILSNLVNITIVKEAVASSSSSTSTKESLIATSTVKFGDKINKEKIETIEVADATSSASSSISSKEKPATKPAPVEKAVEQDSDNIGYLSWSIILLIVCILGLAYLRSRRNLKM